MTTESYRAGMAYYFRLHQPVRVTHADGHVTIEFRQVRAEVFIPHPALKREVAR